MKFEKTTRYRMTWYEIESPNVRGYPWYLHRKQGGYDVEYAGATEGADDEAFSYDPSSPEEQKLIDDAKLMTIIKWAHKDIMGRIGNSESEQSS